MIEGDGSFQYYLNGFNPIIQITQSNRHRPLLENIKTYLNAGYLKPAGNSLNMEDTKNLRLKKSDLKIVGNLNMTNKMFPLLEEFNLYSKKGHRLKLLKKIVNIFYTVKDHQKRTELMRPLVEEIQIRIPVDPNSPYRILPKLEELDLIDSTDAKELLKDT